MSNEMEFGDERDILPGKVYRDLDGSLIELLSAVDGLCSWISITGTPQSVQTTHFENFRRRFRILEMGRTRCEELSA